MPLHKMPIQPAAHGKAAFQVDRLAGLPLAQLCFLEGFLDGSNAILAVFYLFNGQAGSIMAYALVGPEFARKRAFYPESFVGTVGNDLFNYALCFYNTGKHSCKLTVIEMKGNGDKTLKVKTIKLRTFRLSLPL
jgi:hypothetical protein